MQRRQALIVGVFLTVGIVALIWLTKYADDEHNLFGRRARNTYRARFESAAGLSENDSVFVLGLRAGRITKTEFIRDKESNRNLVEVCFEVEQQYTLTEGTTARIVMASLMAGKRLEIVPGKPDAAVLPEESLVPVAEGIDVESLVASATQALAAVSDTVEEVRPALSKTMGNIERITGSIEPEKVSEIVEDIRRLAANFREVAEKVNQGEGTVARLINDQQMSDNVKKSLEDLAATVKDVRQLVAETSEGKGTLGLILKDPETATNVKEVVQRARDVMVNVAESKGTLGRIINEPDVYDTLKTVMDDVSKVTEALKGSEGTLGALINDPQLRLELTRLLTEAREAVEDAREAAPLTAFGSLLFSFIP